ncbi:hypothetical protein Taro_046540 [Colocasia esculenta]|uniref:Uncharacterized protein n=1 Tax=Colocasia esculenta TaxID=4460 RepID=A0A843WSP4_COLES|nr:hypothetical protein [Colocasia esculenta]
MIADPFRMTVKDTTLACGQSLKTPEKFKLQLFPIDNNIRRVLLELNHNPYLELTLRPRKKISSVVKHLNVKWGFSRKKSSELMLFPYEAQTENIVNHRKWTLKDTGTSAADVFMAIGHPEVFRLRLVCSYKSMEST